MAEYFVEYRQLFEEFDGQFEEDGDSTVYAWFKCGVVDGSSFAEKFNAFAKIGWQSMTDAMRMKIERKGAHEKQ